MNDFENWWNAQTLKGGARSNPDLLRQAFEAGRRAGYRDAVHEARDIAAESTWKERQGEEYGSY